MKTYHSCDLENAINELKAALKETWIYKIMIRLLDWLSYKLEK